MDYSLAALKLFCSQLKDASPVESSSPSAMTLGPIIFQRAWLQGVLVSGSKEGRFILDDGSGIVELSMSNELRNQEWRKGMYVMVIGIYVIRTSDLPLIKLGLWPFMEFLINDMSLSRPKLILSAAGTTDLLIFASEVQVHKIVDLSPYPDREAMWHLEVIEAYKLFYQPCLEE